MKTYELNREQFVAHPRDRVFKFFSSASNLEAITPPWLSFRITTPTPIQMSLGTKIDYQIRWRFVRMSWLSEIVEWYPPNSFMDVQLEGPYSLWRHRHTFVEELGGTRIVDAVRYRLPLGPLGQLAHRLKVRKDLETIFDYRTKRIRELLEGDKGVLNPSESLATTLAT